MMNFNIGNKSTYDLPNSDKLKNNMRKLFDDNFEVRESKVRYVRNFMYSLEILVS